MLMKQSKMHSQVIQISSLNKGGSEQLRMILQILFLQLKTFMANSIVGVGWAVSINSWIITAFCILSLRLTGSFAAKKRSPISDNLL